MKKTLLALFLASLSFTAQSSEVYFYKLEALGTDVTSQIKDEKPEHADFCAKVVEDETKRLEQLLSAYIKTSDISRLGAAKGEWIEVSPDTAELLSATRDICEQTGGALDPTVGTLVKHWAIDQPNHRVLPKEEIQKLLPLVDWTQLKVKEENGKYYAKIGKDQEITVGATGKGFISDKIVQALQKNGCKDVLISLGGNIYAIGTNQENLPWSIGLQQPDLSRGEYFAVVPADNMSVVTSGDYEKYFIKDGKKYQHILNPKTGEPIEATLSSVTILDKNSTFADGMCTALFVMGWDGAIKFLEKHPSIHAVLVDEGLRRVAYTYNLSREITITDPKYERVIILPDK